MAYHTLDLDCLGLNGGSITSCVTFGQLLDFSFPQIHHLWRYSLLIGLLQGSILWWSSLAPRSSITSEKPSSRKIKNDSSTTVYFRPGHLVWGFPLKSTGILWILILINHPGRMWFPFFSHNISIYLQSQSLSCIIRKFKNRHFRSRWAGSWVSFYSNNWIPREISTKLCFDTQSTG
jgi:hypothetical protein